MPVVDGMTVFNLHTRRIYTACLEWPSLVSFSLLLPIYISERINNSDVLFRRNKQHQALHGYGAGDTFRGTRK